MSRVKRGVMAHKKHKKLLLLTKGFRGRRKSIYRIAKQALIKSKQYSYIDNRNKKRVLKSKWINYINDVIRNLGGTYSKFIYNLKKNFINLNKKSLYYILRDKYSINFFLKYI